MFDKILSLAIVISFSTAQQWLFQHNSFREYIFANVYWFALAAFWVAFVVSLIDLIQKKDE